MMSQASGLCSMGSGRSAGMSLMDEIRPSPRTGRGIPPCTQNTCMHHACVYREEVTHSAAAVIQYASELRTSHTFHTFLSMTAAIGMVSKALLVASQTSSPSDSPNFWIHSLATREREQLQSLQCTQSRN